MNKYCLDHFHLIDSNNENERVYFESDLKEDEVFFLIKLIEDIVFSEDMKYNNGDFTCSGKYDYDLKFIFDCLKLIIPNNVILKETSKFNDDNYITFDMYNVGECQADYGRHDLTSTFLLTYYTLIEKILKFYYLKLNNDELILKIIKGDYTKERYLDFDSIDELYINNNKLS